MLVHQDPEVDGSVPGLLSVGGDSRSLICASLSPSTHWTSRVLRRGQLDVQRAETATQEHPDSISTLRPAGKTIHEPEFTPLNEATIRRSPVNLGKSAQSAATRCKTQQLNPFHCVLFLCSSVSRVWVKLRLQNKPTQNLISWMIQQRH